ncbi:hypothetical protein HPB51_021716 [Rhipicephalus microplus]|uniref:Uncharacterized protein n=1 Tax=Rhipicephalus microplus TaxID=6941 RepID=A0A9J6DPH0_RHIMP|nr:hypothetical protein HPB51_021716 [Rhipicephalus microplus]
MARGGKKLPGHGGRRGRHRGGRRGVLRIRPRGAHRGGRHHVQGRGRGHHQGGAHRARPAGPSRRILRGLGRQQPHARVGQLHGTKRKSKGVAARDDMNFVNEVDKPSSAAIADAIEQGSSTSSGEAVQGPLLELEEDKLRQEAEARKDKEAEEGRLQEEEANRLQEQEQRKEEAPSKVEDAGKEQEGKKQDDEKQDEKKQVEEAVGSRKEEQQLLEAQKATVKEDAPLIEQTKSVSPITKQIMDVVDNIQKLNANPERPAMADASTETVNDILYKQAQQARMPEYEVQAVPMMRPVASYVIKRPRSETRLERLLSFFGLASPQEPDQEVIEYSFIEPTATWSLYDGQEQRPVRYEQYYQKQWKGSEKMLREDQYDESSESSDSEGSSDDLEEIDREDYTRRRRKKRKAQERQSANRKKKYTLHRDTREGAGPRFDKTTKDQLGQMDKTKWSTAECTGATTERVSGMGYVEEITEEVMQPQRNIYGQPLGPRLRKMRVEIALSPIFTLPTKANSATVDVTYFGPMSTSMDSVCTCAVKCGDHCIGLGRRKSQFLERPKPSSWSSTSVYKYENTRSFEDRTPIYGKPSFRSEGRRLEDLEARIRAEEEARLLRSRLRLLETVRYEEKARFDELCQEEEALRLERQRLQKLGGDDRVDAMHIGARMLVVCHQNLASEHRVVFLAEKKLK